MAKNKTKPSVVKGNHLTVTTDENGRTSLEWDWEALRKEVEEAIASVNKDLVKETEAKVKKSRAKKSEVTTQITDAVTTKKPASKKAATKKVTKKTK